MNVERVFLNSSNGKKIFLEQFNFIFILKVIIVEVIETHFGCEHLFLVFGKFMI